MKVTGKRISFIIPNVKQPRFNKRISEFSATNIVTMFYFNRENYNNLNPIPRANHAYNLGTIENGKYFSRIIKLFNLFKKLKKNINESEIFYVFGLDLLLVTVIANKNKIWYELGDIRQINNKIIDYLLSYFYKKFIFKRVDFISVTSIGFKDYLINKYNIHKNKIKVKENFILKSDFSNIKIRQKKLPKKFVVGIVGFLRYKTIISFLQDYLKNRDNNFVIHIYGQGPLLKDIIKIISNTNIKYFGQFKYPDDIPNIYRKIHFSFVLYDNHDINVRLALPNKLYETIFFKTPILVSDKTFLCKQASHELGVGNCFNPEYLMGLINYLNDDSLKEKYEILVKNINKVSEIKYLK